MPGLFRLLAVRVAYSRQLRCQLTNTRDATQSDCIIAFAPPIIAHCTGFWTSPVLLMLLRICLPTCQNVSPFSSVPRLAHFAEKDSLFRDTRQSLACHTHAPSQHPTNTHVPDLSGRLSSRHLHRSFNRSLRMTLFHSFRPTSPTFHTLTLPSPPSSSAHLCPPCPSPPLPPLPPRPPR